MLSRLLRQQASLRSLHSALICSVKAADSQQTGSCVAAGSKLQIRQYALDPNQYEMITADAGLARIDEYMEEGFVVNQIGIAGSVLACGTLATMWKVERLSDITPDSLAILLLLKPAPDLLVLGTGRRLHFVPETLRAWLRENDVLLEAVDTANAVATFNILNKEARMVVGAFLPLAAPT